MLQERTVSVAQQGCSFHSSQRSDDYDTKRLWRHEIIIERYVLLIYNLKYVSRQRHVSLCTV